MPILIQPYRFKKPETPFTTGLLDSYSGALVACSVRKLDKDYTGQCMRVRRSSDNTETDIGFTIGGNLDEDALLSFVGSGSGFITTWYDQSGNSNHATQTTSGYQPRIVLSGSTDTVNGKPGPYFYNSYFSLPGSVAAYFSGYRLPGSVHVVLKNTTSEHVSFIGLGGNGAGGTSTRWFMLGANANYLFTGKVDDLTNVDFWQGNSLTQNVQYIAQMTHSGALVSSWANNNINLYQAPNDLETMTLDRAFLGSTGYGPYPYLYAMRGNLQEVILYAQDQTFSATRSGVCSNMNTYFGTY